MKGNLFSPLQVTAFSMEDGQITRIDKIGIPAVYTSYFQDFSGLTALYSSLNYTLIAAIGDHKIGGTSYCTPVGSMVVNSPNVSSRIYSLLSLKCL
jgi:hypothetical protein